MRKYTVLREKKKVPIIFFFLLLISILVFEIYYFNLLYNKRTRYLNVQDYKPIRLSVGNNLEFIKGDFPISATINSINIFLFKNFSISLSSKDVLKIYSNNAYHLLFSDGKNEYEFFGKVLYLRSF